MATGQNHDKATKACTLPFGLVISLIAGLQLGTISAFGFLVGGLWLSPDLDTLSRPLQRWGVLKSFWWPYRKFIPHRSFLSHGPFIGTMIRLIYVMTVIILILFVLMPFKVAITPLMAIKSTKEILNQHYPQILAITGGLEASAWLHLIKDGDPLPTQWRKK